MRTNELYTSTPVRAFLGQTLRPGGTELTKRLLELAAVRPGNTVLDAGCGCGATLILLEKLGARGIGLDMNAAFLREAPEGRVVRADVSHLPLSPASLDLIICECAWNLTDKARSMAEFFRVLRPGGLLALSDIFTRGEKNEAWPVRCCFAQATDLGTVVEHVVEAGFTLDLLEDHSPLLARTAAEFVFRHGSLHGFWQAVTGDADLAQAACRAAHAARPGLFLLMARRS